MFGYTHPALPWKLSLLEWAVFSFYWSSKAKNASPAAVSESPRSRRSHVVLLYAAFFLSAISIPGLDWKLPLGAGYTVWLGVAVQYASLALAVWARRHLAAHWSGEITIKTDHVLIQSGPYRWIRHPIYTAVLGMFLGSSLVSERVLAIVGFAVACYAYVRKIHLEERNLEAAFGEAYEVYRTHTGVLIPKMTAG